MRYSPYSVSSRTIDYRRTRRGFLPSRLIVGSVVIFLLHFELKVPEVGFRCLGRNETRMVQVDAETHEVSMPEVGFRCLGLRLAGQEKMGYYPTFQCPRWALDVWD